MGRFQNSNKRSRCWRDHNNRRHAIVHQQRVKNTQNIVIIFRNSIPPTTTVENFHRKLEAAHNQLHVDVAFWGGLVKGNKDELLRLVDAGVVGFKCFMCPSGVDEFPYADTGDIDEALKVLEKTDSVLAVYMISES